MGEGSRCKANGLSVPFIWYIGPTSGCGSPLIVTALTLSSLQKGVMIAHRNVIANVLQATTYESPYRESLKKANSDYTETVLGLLPQSHIYSLVVVCHSHPYRGDQVINLPKFEIKQFLQSIQRFSINNLYLVSHPRAVSKGNRCAYYCIFLPGTPNHHRDGEEQGSLRQVQLGFCGVHIYRRGTSWL